MAYGTAITPVSSSRSGVDLPQAVAGASQMSFINTENEILVVKNAGASPITVTIKIALKVDGAAVSSKTVSVAAGATKMIGPFPEHIYDQADGLIHFDLSATSNVTVGVIKTGSL